MFPKARESEKPRCPFCGEPFGRPPKVDAKREGDFFMWLCSCAAVGAYDATGHNLGDALMEAMAFACDGVMLEQAVYQKSTGIFLAALAGVNVIGGAGTLDGAMAAGLTQLAIDDEMAGMTRRFFEGFEINSEKMALEVIQRTGPRGHFLTDLHTLENCRKEKFWMPTVFSWQNYAIWQDEKKGLRENAQEKVARILNEHEVPPLDEAIVRELDKILKSADKNIG